MEALSGKKALVTGGGTGIGLGIALALADAGCQVAIAGRRAEPLEAAKTNYHGTVPLATHTVDVGDPESVAKLFKWAAKELGELDILVNSAGVNVVKRTMEQLSAEDWETMLRINASGTFYCMQAALPAMRKRGDGLIVNIGSVAGKRASVLGGVGYAASKFAVTGLTLTAAIEEAKHGIRITCIYPGEVETPILDRRPTPVSKEHRARILQPSDIGSAVAMIAALPPRAHVAELVIKPTSQEYV